MKMIDVFNSNHSFIFSFHHLPLPLDQPNENNNGLNYQIQSDLTTGRIAGHFESICIEGLNDENANKCKCNLN